MEHEQQRAYFVGWTWNEKEPKRGASEFFERVVLTWLCETT